MRVKVEMDTMSSGYGVLALGSWPSLPHKILHFPARIIWRGLLSLIQRLTRYKKDDRLKFNIGFSVRDLMTDKKRAVKDQMEALAAAVQKAGSYPAREEANRAVHAVIEALGDRVPSDVLMKLSESLPVREAAKLRRAAAQKLRKKP